MMLNYATLSKLCLLALLLAACSSSDYKSTPEGNRWRLARFGAQEAKIDSAELIFIDGEIFRNSEFYPMRTFYSLPVHKTNDPLWRVLENRFAGDSIEYISYTPDFLHPDSLAGDTLHYFFRIDRMRTTRQLNNRKRIELAHLDTLARSDSVAEYYTEYKGIYFRSIEPGKKAEVRWGRELVIQYRGYTLSGKVFDDSRRMDSPLRFIMGDDQQVISGIEIALEKMHLHEKARVIIPSWLAFGADGSAGDRVPSYATVIYEIEVTELGI